MIVNGRIVRPTTLAERRLMMSLGLTTSFRCSRSENPFALARKLRRLSENKTPDAEYVRRLAKKKNNPPPALPDSRPDAEQAA